MPASWFQSIWQNQERRVDAAVDRQFAEPVELWPWVKPQYTGEGGPDPARQHLRTYGIFVMPGATATGEGGTVGAGLTTRVVTNDVWFSITEDKIIDYSYWKEGDRVYLPDRDEWFALTFITPSATGRPNLNLVRIQKVDVITPPKTST